MNSVRSSQRPSVGEAAGRLTSLDHHDDGHAEEASRPSSRPGLRERKQARTRAELKAVADRLFDLRGFDHVTVEDICTEVDLSPRTFFRYFRNKDDIVFAGLQPRYDRTLEELRKRPAEEPAYEALSAAILDTLGDPDYEREAHRIHRQITASPELMRASLATYRRFRDQLVDLLVDRPPCNGDTRRARLLIGVALVAVEIAIDEWSEHPGRPLRPQLEATLRQTSGTVTTLDS